MGKSVQATKHLVPSQPLEIASDLVKLYRSGDQKYLMVNIIAARSRELNKGEAPLIAPPPPGTTYTDIALAELTHGKLRVLRKQKSKVLVSLIKNE